MSFGVRQGLKIYSGVLGAFVCLSSFLWVMFHVYLIFQTPDYETELRMARYLDICFGCLAFFSSLALMYGAFVESKTWLSAWTLGSMTVVIGMWGWYFHKKYSKTPHPEVMTPFERTGEVLTGVYVAAILPVWFFQRQIETWDWRFTLGNMCPNFVLRNHTCHHVTMPNSTSRNSRPHPALAAVVHHQVNNNGNHYLPTYAQCTTNTFLAPTHTHVSHHLPASKG